MSSTTIKFIATVNQHQKRHKNHLKNNFSFKIFFLFHKQIIYKKKTQHEIFFSVLTNKQNIIFNLLFNLFIYYLGAICKRPLKKILDFSKKEFQVQWTKSSITKWIYLFTFIYSCELFRVVRKENGENLNSILLHNTCGIVFNMCYRLFFFY